MSASATRATRTFGLDQNGRIVTDASAVDTSGAPNSTTSFTFPFSGGATRGGVDSVIRGATANGVNYNYFYDSRNRRTRKQFPTAVEEFFYDPAGRLLSERSFTYLTNSEGNTTDEYIWLGDAPVAMIRTLFTGAMVRTADWNGVPSNGSTVCPRRNEDARCATFFYVTDMQGRPTASIDKDAYLTGVGEYDVFGTINRVVQRAETAHPYSNSQNYNLVAQVGRDRYAYTLPMRARFSFVDTNANYACGMLSCADADRAEVRDSSGVKVPLKATVKGQHLGAAVTAWFTTGNDRFDVRWTSDANGTLRDGVVFAGYDYQRVQVGGVRAFPPLRAPGQYFDEETGLHENWNRYYDPAAGRYLSPEPLLQSPGYVRTMAARGMQVPTYAYALNSPLRYVDFNGLDPGDSFRTQAGAARDAFQYLAQQHTYDSTRFEYGGYIYQQADGNYSYTPPRSDRRRGAWTPRKTDLNACGANPPVGDYHNHPGGSPPSESDLRASLRDAQAIGRDWESFVSTGDRFWSTEVVQIPGPSVSIDRISVADLPGYFGPPSGGFIWW